MGRRNPDFSFVVYFPNLVNRFFNSISRGRDEIGNKIVYYTGERERVEFVMDENRFNFYGAD